MDTFSILVFNAGNHSLKISLLDGYSANPLKSVIKGCISDIGGKSSFTWTYGSIHSNIPIEISTHEEAAEWVLDWLQNLWPFGSLLNDVNLVAHRFLDEDEVFHNPFIVTDKVMSQLEKLTKFATLQNSKVIAVLQISQKKFARKALTVATFDTAISLAAQIHDTNLEYSVATEANEAFSYTAK